MISNHTQDFTASFEREFTVGYSTMDVQGLIKIVSIMNFLQDTASEHAGYLGASGFDLARQGFAWVIHRYHIEIHSHPQFLETVSIRTHRHSFNNLYEIREIAMETPDRENRFITSKVAWVMVNKKNQHPVRLDRYLPPEMVAHCLTQNPFTPPPGPLERMDFELFFRVRMHDLDMNRHVNNAIYVEWAVETLPRDMLEKYRPGTIDVIFQKQAFYGDIIVSRTQISLKDNLPVTVHTIVRASDQGILATLKVLWKERRDHGETEKR